MLDERILEYRRAAEELKDGRFDIQVPVGTEQDEVERLGRALIDLAETLEKKFGQINRLAEVTQQINSGLVLEEVLNYVYDSFRSLIPYQRIGFSFIDSDGETLRAHWARSDSPTIQIGRGYSASLKGSSLQRVLQTQQLRILNDLVEYLREHPDSESTSLIIQEGMRSSLTCPLIVLGKPIGFIFFSSRERNAYRNVHVELFLQVAGQLSQIVEKSRLYEQLLELNQLKDRFLGMAVHDLRNPLGIIQGYLRLLLDGVLGEVTGQQQRDAMETMVGTCTGMLGLINDLLDINAIESGHLELQLEEVDLAEYLQGCHSRNRMLAQAKSIQLELQLPPNLPCVRLDANRFDQVLGNLIGNGIKFSYPETTITLSAEVQADSVAIGVSDQGQGIPEEEQAKLFTDFGQTSVRPTAGERTTGLGLAIVKRIVVAHGGSIEVQSEVGKGSTFTVVLPLETNGAI